MSNSNSIVSIDFFTDLLCIWAYVSCVRVEELVGHYPERVAVRPRFVSVFGDTANKIGEGWADRGGWSGYAAHVQEVAAKFDHIELHPDVWTRDHPASSTPVHVYLHAARLAAAEASGSVENGESEQQRLMYGMRSAFLARPETSDCVPYNKK